MGSTLAVASALLTSSVWFEIDSRRRVGPEISRTGLIERELLCDGGEQVVDVGGGLCRGLKEEQTGFFCVLLGIGSLNGSLVWVLVHNVFLVAGQRDDDIFIGLSLELLDPRFRLI